MSVSSFQLGKCDRLVESQNPDGIDRFADRISVQHHLILLQHVATFHCFLEVRNADLELYEGFRIVTAFHSKSAYLVQAQAWPDKAAEFYKESRALAFERQSHSFTRPDHLSASRPLAEACLHRAAERIIEAALQLDEWDKRCPPILKQTASFPFMTSHRQAAG